VFGTQKWSRAVTDLIIRQKEFLKDEIYNFMDKFNIDLLIPENCLAIPMHIPLGLALTEVILETEVPVIAHHHDFYWERTRFLINAVGDIISSSFPPDLPSIKHVVINSMIQKDLAAKRGISSTVIYNVIDFDKEISPIDDFNRDFRKDLGFAEDDILILQPTRVVSRKGIEQALYLIQRLNLPKAKLLISHSAGDEGSEYFDWISESAKQQNIPVYFIYNHLHDKRKYDENGKKLYCLWDVYPHIDMVTYPSLYEGFGNAFLEAVYFKKPILVNRYSVYIVDIEPKGFDVIAIDGYLTQKAIEEVHDVLLNESRRTAMVEKNFNLGKKYFSISLLRKRLSSILSSIYGDDV
jgi:glycosyltransferase involved in cell wall biosynthesis